MCTLYRNPYRPLYYPVVVVEIGPAFEYHPLVPRTGVIDLRADGTWSKDHGKNTLPTKGRIVAGQERKN